MDSINGVFKEPTINQLARVWGEYRKYSDQNSITIERNEEMLGTHKVVSVYIADSYERVFDPENEYKQNVWCKQDDGSMRSYLLGVPDSCVIGLRHVYFSQPRDKWVITEEMQKIVITRD